MAQLPIWGMITVNGNIPLFRNKKKNSRTCGIFWCMSKNKNKKNSTKMKNEKCNVMQKYFLQLTFMAKNFSPPLQQTNIRRFWTRRNHKCSCIDREFFLLTVCYFCRKPLKLQSCSVSWHNWPCRTFCLFLIRFFDLGKTMKITEAYTSHNFNTYRKISF